MSYHYVKQQRARDIAARKYVCATCNKACRDITTQRKHEQRHLPKPPRPVRTHTCIPCSYTTSLKQNYNRHMKCSRHLALA